MSGNVNRTTKAPLRLPDKIEYDKLIDPESQIRLLSIASNAETSPIHATLKTRYRSDTLPYNAISYTWGEPQLDKRIFVNGKPVDVRANCWYALWQARLHRITDLWIDALCINQDNAEEKSAQVAQMCEIFRGARCVYCSVGEHAQDSLWLCQQIRSAKFGLESKPIQSPGDADRNDLHMRADSSEEEDNEEMPELDSDHLDRFVTAYNKFSMRPYWHRLWTLQEALVGQRRELWCDTLRLEFQLVLDLPDHVTSRIKERNLECCDLGDLRYFSSLASKATAIPSSSSVLRVPEAGVFKKLCSKQCSDPRDLLYGSLVITNLPLVPDYSKSPCRVALEAIHRLVPEATHVLMHESKYDSRNWKPPATRLSLQGYREDMLQILKRMCIDGKGQVIAEDHIRRISEELDQTNYGDKSRTSIHLVYCGRVGQFRRDHLGRLYIEFNEVLSSHSFYASLRANPEFSHSTSALPTQRIFSHTGVEIGVTNAESSVADLLVPNGRFDYAKHQERFLVLKRSCFGLYEVTGQAFICRPLDSLMHEQWLTVGRSLMFYIELHIYLADFIVNCLQAIVPPSVDQDAWMNRCAIIDFNGFGERLHMKALRSLKMGVDERYEI